MTNFKIPRIPSDYILDINSDFSRQLIEKW